MAFDALPAIQNIYVEYQNLSSVPQYAEMQKDILSQFLKKVFDKETLLMEYNKETAQENVENFVLVKCTKCYELKQGTLLLSNSLSESHSLSSQLRAFHFQTYSVLGESKYWYVQLEEKQKSYYLSACGTLKQGEILNKSNVSIKGCFPDQRKCHPQEPQDNFLNAQEKLKKTIGKNTVKSFFNGEEITSKYVSEPQVIHVHDPVKIFYENSSGLKIKAFGKALSSGAFGEMVKIEVHSGVASQPSFAAKKIISAMVSAPGEVRYVGN